MSMATRKPEKQAAAPRNPRAKKEGPPFTGTAGAHPSPEEVWKLIAETAYFKAKARHFAPGNEVQDWIEAEAEVMHRLGRSA
jgi:hypothetical protein